MKRFDLGQSVNLLANVGVLIGILLLVFELNQNRQMMEAQTRHDMAQGIVNLLAELASNSDLAELEHRGRCGRLTSAAEEIRFFAHVNARLRYWEDAHYQYRRGLYDESEALVQREAWRAFIQTPQTLEYWDRMKGGFSPEFVAEIDALTSEAKESPFVVVGCD